MPDKHQNRKRTFRETDLKTLRAFVDGYLHQDFLEEYKTAAEAVNAYCQEASRKEIVDLQKDLNRFIDATRALDFREVKELFVRELRSGWVPPGSAALDHLSQVVRDNLADRNRR